MPEPAKILEGLEAIANELWPVAVLWHVLAAAALIAVVGGWRPSRRLIAVLLVLPVASVAIAAWTGANAFNGLTFAVLALALGGIGLRLPRLPPAPAPAWARLAGIGMAAFGLVYPHFTHTSSPVGYLYAAPTGLVPCPTLSLAIGVTLLADGLGSRAFALALAAAGLFYGILGVARLGVTLDLGLVAGAGLLLARGLTPSGSPRHGRATPPAQRSSR
jgi:hypothetical protein